MPLLQKHAGRVEKEYALSAKRVFSHVLTARVNTVRENVGANAIRLFLGNVCIVVKNIGRMTEKQKSIAEENAMVYIKENCKKETKVTSGAVEKQS